VLARWPIEAMQPGDVFITNHPWLCAGHLPDICIITPVFRHGRVVAFCASVAHANDIGGTRDERLPREVYEEGVLIPLSKLYDRGQLNQGLLDVFAANVRFPEEAVGDVEAEVTANEVGAERLLALMDEYGLDDLSALAAEIEGRSERAMRAAIAAIPDGVYRGRSISDGAEEPLVIQAAVDIRGDELYVDYTGSSAQVGRGGTNSPLIYTISHTCYALKCALLPGTPNNEGCYRMIHVSAPEGSILNARYPASCNSRTRTGWHIGPALFDALQQALPENVIAGCGLLQSSRVYCRGADGQGAIVSYFAAGGQGAGWHHDGRPGYIYPSTAAGMAAEIWELRSPTLSVEKRILPDTGGAGRRRGGPGQRIALRRLPGWEGQVGVHFYPDRARYPAPGLLGGQPGAPARVQLNGQTLSPDDPVYREGYLALRDGDLFTFDLPGGGGVGDPRQREPERVRADLERGWVTPEAARTVYGVE